MSKDKCRDCKYYFKNITLSSPVTWGGWYKGDIGNCRKKSGQFAVKASQAICRDFSRPVLQRDIIPRVIPAGVGSVSGREKIHLPEIQATITINPQIPEKESLFMRVYNFINKCIDKFC